MDLDRFRRQEHHDMFRRLRAEEPVAWHPLPGRRGFWNVVRHPDVVTVNRDSQLFSSEAQGVVGMFAPDEIPDELGAAGDPRGVMMIYTDPPRHTRYRLLVNKGFTPRTVGLLEQYLRHRARVVVDGVIERGEADFVTDVASELPLQAIAEIMGVPQEDRKLIFDWSNRIIGMDDPEFASDDGARAFMELYAYVNELGRRRRSDPREDIVTKLVNAEIEGDRLSEMEFDMFMLLLSVAGNETTRNSAAWGMLALMEHPDAYRELRDDPALLPTAVEEILRWASPVLHFRRTATEDAAVGGQPIARGDKVVMWYVSANRDETVFDDPFRFDIYRRPNPHIAFGGGGAHYCLGANLARMEVRLLFEEVVARVADPRPAGPPEFLRSNFIGGVKHLPVAFTPGRRAA